MFSGMGEGMAFYQNQVTVVSHSPDRTGVRICPGRHLAFASLWINIASILAMFKISRAADSAPDQVLSSEEQFTNTLVRYDRLPSLIDQQADTSFPACQSRLNVRSNHALRRQRNWSPDYYLDDYKVDNGCLKFFHSPACVF